MSLLVIFDILGIFINTMVADEMFPLRNRDNLRHLIDIQLSKKLKHFLKFLQHFWTPHQTFDILKKRRVL